MQTLGNRLRILRKEKCISLDKMAQDLNTTKVTLSRYETGAREPKIDTLNILANYFGVSVDYLLGRDISIDSNKTYQMNDVKAILNSFFKKSKYSADLTFDGEPLSEEEYNSFIQSLEVVIELASQRKKNKTKNK